MSEMLWSLDERLILTYNHLFKGISAISQEKKGRKKIAQKKNEKCLTIVLWRQAQMDGTATVLFWKLWKTASWFSSSINSLWGKQKATIVQNKATIIPLKNGFA